jgi:hypothetical protein
MKKRIFCVLAVCMMVSFAECGFADGTDAGKFVKVKAPIGENASWLACARYRDTKEVIPLSLAWQEHIYATIPVENKGRQIEAFIPEPIAFTDINDENPDFHDVKMLSYCGVIRGDDKGEARIYDNVTRAEAVAMVMRFIGLEKVEREYIKLRFDDVKEDDWFYTVIMNAFDCGIVQGDSERIFSPNRNVTREEITVMVARALQYAGARCLARQVENLGDKEAISDWAKDAYEFIGYNYIADYSSDPETIDWENPQQFLHPQKAATRAEVAYVLNNTRDECQLYASEAAEQLGFDKEMPVIDGSTSTYPFTQAVYSMLFRNGHTHPQFPLKHAKSHASYQRLINGEVDMLFASV